MSLVILLEAGVPRGSPLLCYNTGHCCHWHCYQRHQDGKHVGCIERCHCILERRRLKEGARVVGTSALRGSSGLQALLPGQRVRVLGPQCWKDLDHSPTAITSQFPVAAGTAAARRLESPAPPFLLLLGSLGLRSEPPSPGAEIVGTATTAPNSTFALSSPPPTFSCAYV